MSNLFSSVPVNDTDRVRAYRNHKQALAALRRSRAPEDQRAWRDMRDAVVREGTQSLAAREASAAAERILTERGLLGERAVTPSSVHSNTFMANMSVMYANEAYIGAELLPMLPVDKLSDEYAIYSKRDRLAAPSLLMKNRSTAVEVFDNRSSASYTCEGYGVKKGIEKKTIDNQDAVFDEMMDLNDMVSDILAFDFEKRAMTALTTSGNYASTTAIASGSEWDSAGGGDPVKAIRTARHSLWNGNGPGRVIGFCPLSVYLVLGSHPAILDLTKYTSAGIVPRQVLAAVFELDDLLIAKAWEDTANEGQTASYSRIVTSDIFGIVRVAAPSKRNAGFGFNFRFKGEVNNLSWYEEKEGTRGTYYNQQSCDEVIKIVASDTGHLLTNCLA
jgi:hypothetical protein